MDVEEMLTILPHNRTVSWTVEVREIIIVLTLSFVHSFYTFAYPFSTFVLFIFNFGLTILIFSIFVYPFSIVLFSNSPFL